MKNKYQFFCITIIIFLSLSLQNVLSFEHFITRNGSTLMDGDVEFRFVSVNIPNYFIVEDRAGTIGEQWHRTTAFEQRDAARAVKRLGGQVFRTYCFSVEEGRNVTGKLAHIYTDENGQIMYNEDLFRDVYRGLAIAAEEGVRLIIPIVDNWEYGSAVLQNGLPFQVQKASGMIQKPKRISKFSLLGCSTEKTQ